MTAKSPLQWPRGVERSPFHISARFRTPLREAYAGLIDEVIRLGGEYPLITSNRPVRKDRHGFIVGAPEPSDPGVSVFFRLNGRDVAFACDYWDTVAANMRAIALTINAMRGIERWGVAEAQARAFAGFAEFPPPSDEWWRDVLGLRGEFSVEDVARAFRHAAKLAHPDNGGSSDAFMRLMEARNAALNHLRNSGAC